METPMILLDTNLVIYLLYGNTAILQWFQQFGNDRLAISIISWIEVLAGSFHHQKTRKEIESELKHFVRLTINTRIARHAAQLLEQGYKKRGRLVDFQDSIIAATALSEHMPLLTNNPKDFRAFKGLKVISPK